MTELIEECVYEDRIVLQNKNENLQTIQFFLYYVAVVLFGKDVKIDGWEGC